MRCNDDVDDVSSTVRTRVLRVGGAEWVVVVVVLRAHASRGTRVYTEKQTELCWQKTDSRHTTTVR